MLDGAQLGAALRDLLESRSIVVSSYEHATQIAAEAMSLGLSGVGMGPAVEGRYWSVILSPTHADAPHVRALKPARAVPA